MPSCQFIFYLYVSQEVVAELKRDFERKGLHMHVTAKVIEVVELFYINSILSYPINYYMIVLDPNTMPTLCYLYYPFHLNPLSFNFFRSIIQLGR